MAKMIHSMIRVLDLQRAIDFYAQALELGVLERFEFDDFTLVYLRNEETDFELELTVNHARSEPYGHDDGYGHPAVCVDDCQTERQRLSSLGLDPGEIKELHRNGTRLARFFFIVDPDGYRAGALRSLSMTTQLHSKTKVREQVRR
jgi:lactoylglutathione lyase